MKKINLNKETIQKLDEAQLSEINGGAAGFLTWFGCGCGQRATDPQKQNSCKVKDGSTTTTSNCGGTYDPAYELARVEL